ncbi:Pre-rRNA-processing protein ESF1 [Rhodotorula diobovata]|uniref:Pre-rRNA-processing protein ESF1 n=1 Tax=Rhodotorula diobovata TaxID=5288 RepID=A0A5C5G0C2_9BASI|nr:Pre-rRNA-processing protein ESF1 [Rhodotorula diobovata]
MSGPRFARLHTDPRFVRPKASKTKFVVDDRFKQLFEDPQASGSKKSKLARKVDKYGRPLEKEASAAGARPGFVDLARGEVLLESSDEEGDEAVSDAESDSSSAAGSVTLGGRTSRRRPSRSPSIDLSETEPTSLFPDEDDEAAQLPDEDDEDDAEPTRRLAIVNMDWDHLRASDLYRVLASCLSATAASIQQRKPSANDDRDAVKLPSKLPSKLAIAPGRLKSLRIYPSQFGRERMEREAVEGPPVDVLRAKGAESSDEDEDDGKTLKLGRKDKGKQRRRRAASDDEDDDLTAKDLVDEQLQEGDDYDTEALRKYQLERLRYYFAIATFDSVASAKHVVEQVNGTEFERTANVFDLQYVPDDTSFDDDPVHDEATEASIAAEGNAYTGIDFQTDALRHSKVKLTWDADDPHRKTKLETFLAAALDRSKQKGATKGKPKIGEDDIAQYLASSSDEEDGAEGDEDEQDDFFEAAEKPAPAPAAAEAPASGKPKKEAKRERLRSLLGLAGGDGTASEVTWDGGDVHGGKQRKGADAGMQITFAPALSERSAKQLEFTGGDERQETSIEAYKRKEKERRERKKLERRARNEGKTVDELLEEEGMRKGVQGAPLEPRGDDAGFDDDFFADDGEDPFAAYDDGGANSGDEIGGAGGVKGGERDKLSKKAKREQREAEEKANAAEQAQLALLVGSDDEDDVGGEGGEGGRHFDMRKILKSEKNAGKKRKVKGKGKKALGGDKDEVVKDDFKLDLGDDRFKSLYEDYDYAVDPSNPRYQKSRNMEALLTEGRKRRAAKTDKARAPVAPSEDKPRAKVAPAPAESESLRALAESVKRKAGDVGGRGKRAKV